MSARTAHGSIQPKPMLPPDDDLFAPAPVRKWKRRLIIAAVVIVLLLVVAEWFVSAMISKKLSEMLRLDDVHLFDGKIQWRGRAGGNDQPMSFEGLAMDIDTTQQSPSVYTFHLVSRAQLSADVSATGDFDVDSLDLMLRN